MHFSRNHVFELSVQNFSETTTEPTDFKNFPHIFNIYILRVYILGFLKF